MAKNNSFKKKAWSLFLVFALVLGFLPINLVQAADEWPNYAEEEAMIKNYNDKERYRQTDLQPGDTSQTLDSTDERVEKDGFKFELKNPSPTSPSKTQYGYQITIDKKTGQRTYTKVAVTDSGLILVNPGNKPMMGKGDKLTPESAAVSYKPQENTELTSSGRQRNLNYEASNETLEHINNKDNNSTSFGFNDNYTQNNPSIKFFGDSFGITYKVNPWPNENDKLELIKLNGSHNKTEFVQGQTITTDISVENLDDNARERLVGQVYHPVTGKIVPGAKASINEDDKVVITMPEGVIDENGNLNKDSIFYKDPNFKGIQSLEVKFFTRPRTADEFNSIAQAPEEEWDKGTYVETGAGTDTINHKGQDVVIDKQGIDRYDHYNLIGSFKLNLDDTRYYDQGFIDGNNADTSKHTSSAVKPGEEFEVKLYVPEDRKDEDLFPHQKTPEEMEAAKDGNQAVGSIDWQFINKINEGKKPEDQWKLEYDETSLPTTFKITPPKSAKAGDFVAVPLTYTYTNGSTDVHWFHFVVQESTNNRPEYLVQVNYPSIEQKSTPKVPKDDKKLSPTSYSIPDGVVFKDDHGNEWDVSIDATTGEVTAKPIDSSKFDGGEKIQVPVTAHYTDPNEPEKQIEETGIIAEFVIKEKANMTPRYNAKAGKAGDILSSEVILNEEDKFNRRPTKFTLESDTYVDDKGNTWNVSIDENTGTVTATVPNPEEGKSIDGALLNVPVSAHYYEANGEVEVATREVEVQFVSYGTNGTFDKIEEIPFETKVEKDPDLKKGEIKVITEGKKGSKKVTYTIKDSVVDETLTKEVILEEAQERLIHVGEGVNDGTHKIEEKVEIPFETVVEFDDTLAPGEKKVTQEGVPGEKTRTTTLTIEDGKVTDEQTTEFKETKAPVKQIIKVGRNTDGKITHTEKIPFKYEISYDENLKSGEYVIDVPGQEGTKTTTWTISNSQVVGEPEVDVQDPVNAVIRVGKKDYTGEITHKESHEVPFEVEYRYSDELEAGQTKVEQKGEKGSYDIEYSQKIKNGEPDGDPTSTKTNEKAAKNEIVLIGTKPVTKVVEKPFNTEYIYDENLEAGKTEEVTPGKNGKVTITTTYDKDQEKVVTSETEEAATNRVVKIGGKTNGTEIVKEETPFEVEVKKDPSLKKGEWKYATDEAGNELRGEKGEQERILTIENSKVTNISDPTVTKEAKKAVILIGEGTNDGTHEIVEKKALPFETIIEYDDSLEPGEEKVVQEGTPGEQERTNTLVIQDGKVVETKEGEFKTTKEPVNKIVKVGRKPSEGEVTKTIEREIPYETKVIYDENLEAGFQEIENEGKPGKEEVTITQKVKNSKPVGEATETVKTITEKEDRVVRVGVKPVVKEVELGNNTEYRHNPELKAGEEKVIEEGSKGSVKYTTTFNKETGKLEVTEERIEPKNKIVEYGTKTEGEFKYESEQAYNVIIRENPELEAGKHKVVQEGIVGKTETTVKVVNSEEVSRETKTITEKQDMIIEIGTKNVCEIPPIDPENPEDPTDPEVTDPTDPETTDPTDPEVTEPTDPEESEPTDPEESEPTDPEVTEPTDPEVTKPTDPETPGTEKPDKPGSEKPSESSKNPKGTEPRQNNVGKTGAALSAYPVLGLVLVVGAALISKKKKED